MKWIDDAVSHLEALEALGLDARQDKVQLRDMLVKDMKKLILAVRLSERLFTRIEQNTRENSNYARACEGRDRLRLGKVEGNPPHKDKPAVSDEELGLCAIRQLRSRLGQDPAGFSYLTDKDRREIGAAIRAKVAGK